jgi:hypothetical protein
MEERPKSVPFCSFKGCEIGEQKKQSGAFEEDDPTEPVANNKQVLFKHVVS